jgi:uncharacterized Zn finger protein (UPF0148 family)
MMWLLVLITIVGLDMLWDELFPGAYHINGRVYCPRCGPLRLTGHVEVWGKFSRHNPPEVSCASCGKRVDLV